jgi:hypothetical protein
MLPSFIEENFICRRDSLLSVRWLERKEDGTKMQVSLDNDFWIAFQQLFAGIWQKYGSFCFLSYPPQNYSYYLSQMILFQTNRIQREFDSNVRIATFEISPASSHPRQTTNLVKRFVLLCFSVSEACCHFAPPTSPPLFLCLKRLSFAFADLLKC